MAAAAAKAAVIVGGVTTAGYMVMKYTTPDRDQIIKSLPAEYTTKEGISAAEKLNERLFETIKRNIASPDPVWKMRTLEDAEHDKHAK